MRIAKPVFQLISSKPLTYRPDIIAKLTIQFTKTVATEKRISASITDITDISLTHFDILMTLKLHKYMLFAVFFIQIR